MVERNTTERGFSASSERLRVVEILGSSLSESGCCMAYVKHPSVPDVKHLVCTLCARFPEIQELSFKDNTQTEVSRTVIPEFNKKSRLFRNPHYCYATLLFGCELNRAWKYICIIVLRHYFCKA